MKHYGDITKIKGCNVEIPDVVIGGSPCQDLSVAGKRAGLSGERSGLFMEQIRLIKELREESAKDGRADEFIRPRYMVWENVPGTLSSNKGEDFRAVLEETAKIKDKDAVIPRPANGKWTNAGCIMGRGWSIAWRIHDAQFWGVPQRRRRISLVADFNGMSAPEIVFDRCIGEHNAHEILVECKGIAGHHQPSREERKDSTTDFENGIGADDFKGFTASGGGRVSATIDANYYKGCGEREGTERKVVSYGFDGGATRDVGELFIEEQSKTIANGSCPGHHNHICTNRG